MIAKARERGAYDELKVGDAVAMLDAGRRGTFDLIVAADALVYIGDLAPLFAAVGTALASDGLFAFSVETCEGDGFKLEPTMRFAHSRLYVETTAREAGLRPLLVRSASTRREAGADAPGLICVFGRAERRDRRPHARRLTTAAMNSRWRGALVAPAQSVARAATDKPFGNGRRNRTGLRPA